MVIMVGIVSYKLQAKRGFTVVELLIVIVVIGILVTIGILAYNGIRDRANNTTRLAEQSQWVKIFKKYQANYGQYPSMANGGYCLGDNFPIGGGGVARCRLYASTGWASYKESDSAALMNALKEFGNVSGGVRTPVGDTVGPWVIYSAKTIEVITFISGAPEDCPTNAPSMYSDPGRAMCRTILQR